MQHITPQDFACQFLTSGNAAKLSSLEKCPAVPVLLCLCGLADVEGRAEVTQKVVGDMLGLSRRSIVRAFNTLADRKFILKSSRGAWTVQLDDDEHDLQSYVPPCHSSHSYVTPCHLSQERGSYVPPCHSAEKVEETSVIYKELPLRGSSGAGVSTRDTTTQDRQQIVFQLEKIVTETLGQQVWHSSHNWVAALDRASWNMDVITDAVIAYKEKVLDVGERHMFSRLLNFIKIEKAAFDRRYEKEQKKTERPDAAVFEKDRSQGQRVETDDLERLKEWLNV